MYCRALLLLLLAARLMSLDGGANAGRPVCPAWCRLAPGTEIQEERHCALCSRLHQKFTRWPRRARQVFTTSVAVCMVSRFHFHLIRGPAAAVFFQFFFCPGPRP